jgi:hypothetical protein
VDVTPTQPVVLDCSGHPLDKGMRVVTAGFGAMPPGHPQDAGKVLRFEGDPHDPLVWVRWPEISDPDATCDDCYPVYAHPTADAFTCPDLKAVLTPDPESED